MATSTRKYRFYRFHFCVAGGLVLLGTVGLWLALSQQSDWPHWLGCWLVAINVLTFGYYSYDKSRARSQGTRIPELLLHILAALGGSLGAYVGMQVFRHKTIKGKFQILFWCIVVLQILIALWIVQRLWWNSAG